MNLEKIRTPATEPAVQNKPIKNEQQEHHHHKHKDFFYQPMVKLQRDYIRSRVNTRGNANGNNVNAIGGNRTSNNSRNVIELKGTGTIHFDKFLVPKAGQQLKPVVRKSLGPRRAYVAHFSGTLPPNFKGSSLTSIRRNDFKTHIDEIRNSKSLNLKGKEMEIKKS